MRIDDLLESISGRLPAGWSVRCEVENGAAWVCAIGPYGEMHHIDSDEADIELQMEDATVMAQRLSGEKPETVVDVAELKRCLQYFMAINMADLDEIIWTRDGERLRPDRAMLKEFAFTGLSNRDFPEFAGWLDDTSKEREVDND